MNSLTVLKWKSKLQRRQITKQIFKNPLNKIELKQKYCLFLTDKSIQPCEESSPFLLCAQWAGIRWRDLRVKEKGARHFRLFKIGRKSQEQSIQYNMCTWIFSSPAVFCLCALMSFMRPLSMFCDLEGKRYMHSSTCSP